MRDVTAFSAGVFCPLCVTSSVGPRTPTPGGWLSFSTGNTSLGTLLLCYKCYVKESNTRKRREAGIKERRKGKKAKGDW
jgi:hypothetical protein